MNNSEDGSGKAEGCKQEGRKCAIGKPSGKNGFRAQKEEFILRRGKSLNPVTSFNDNFSASSFRPI